MHLRLKYPLYMPHEGERDPLEVPLYMPHVGERDPLFIYRTIEEDDNEFINDTIIEIVLDEYSIEQNKSGEDSIED